MTERPAEEAAVVDDVAYVDHPAYRERNPFSTEVEGVGLDDVAPNRTDEEAAAEVERERLQEEGLSVAHLAWLVRLDSLERERAHTNGQRRVTVHDFNDIPAPPPSPDDASLLAIPFTEITMRSIEWFEKPLWQRSAFQLFAAPKGAGKGTYLAGLAARVSNAGGNVLFVSSEDSAEIDIKPRLHAAGADMSRCYIIRRHVKLPDDVDALREIAEGLGGVDLLIIDPVANHIGDKNSNDDIEVRHAIAPLNPLADRLSCLIIGVRHPGKDRSRGAVASILGSIAWVDTPRAVVMVAPDDEDQHLRHIQVVAGNRSLNGSAQAFRIEAVEVPGLKEPITLVVELGESPKSVDQLLQTRKVADTKTGKARDLLLDILEEEGEQESDALDAHVARETGLSARTVRDARIALAKEGLVKAQPDKDEFGEVKRWKVHRTGAPRP